MEKDFYSQFKKISENTRLSKKELEFHREEILKFMNKETGLNPSKKIVSPFQFSIFFHKHFILTSLVVILAFGTSLGVSSANSLPNNSLYSIKTKVIEPISIFLTPTPKAKAKLRVALVEKRMQEFSQVTINGELSPEDKTDFASQLSSQVKDAHTDISNLVKEKDLSGATEVTNDLQSILSAQDEVLDTLGETNANTQDTREIALVLDDSLQKTDAIENSITETVQTTDNDTELDTIINNQKAEINKTLENLEKEKLGNVSEDADNVEIISQNDIDLKILKIKASLEAADKKVTSGNKKEALELYNQIDQDLGEIESLIHTEQKLQTDDEKPPSEDATLPEDTENSSSE
jgi:hypothetical protein